MAIRILRPLRVRTCSLRSAPRRLRGGGAPNRHSFWISTSANQNADVYHGVQPRMAAEANYRRAGAPPFQIMPPGSISGDRGG